VLNPYICPIEGDLSRADTVALTLLCRDKVVVESGIGGSTIVLSQIAKRVTTYEHEPIWIDRVKPKLGDNCKVVQITKDEDVSKFVEPCDVLFIDGHSLLRVKFVLAFWENVRECIIMHDSRTMYVSNVIKVICDQYVKPKEKGIWDYNKYLASLKYIKWNWLESNMCVMGKRNIHLKHEDWKKTEAENNRVGFGKI